MPKQIDPIKKALVKQARLNGEGKKQALITANYSKATAEHHVSTIPVLKCVDAEIKKEFKLSDVTAESVIKELDEVRDLAKAKGDYGTAGRMIELKGRYIALFTDKVKLDATLITNADQQIIDEYMPKRTNTNRLGQTVAN